MALDSSKRSILESYSGAMPPIPQKAKNNNNENRIINAITPWKFTFEDADASTLMEVDWFIKAILYKLDQQPAQRKLARVIYIYYHVLK